MYWQRILVFFVQPFDCHGLYSAVISFCSGILARISHRLTAALHTSALSALNSVGLPAVL